MKTLAILSQKGGAGKTTLALHLAVAAVQAKRQVAVVDREEAWAGSVELLWA